MADTPDRHGDSAVDHRRGFFPDIRDGADLDSLAACHADHQVISEQQLTKILMIEIQ